MTTEEIQKYLPVSNSFVPDSFDSWLNEARQQFIYPAISKDQYSAIIAMPTSYDADVVDQLNRALICFAYELFLPTHIVQISNIGVTEHTSPDQKTAKPENVEYLRKLLLNTAHENLKRVLVHFEKNESSYLLWVASDEYTIFNDLLIKTTDEFDRLLSIRGSRRVFKMLEPSIRLIQNTDFTERLGLALFNDLLTNTTPNATYLLTKFLKPALARLAFADALPNMMVVLDKYDTITWFDNSANNYAKSYKNVTPSAIEFLIEKYKKQGNELLCKATDYISSNASAFPLYPIFVPTPTSSTDCTTEEYNRIVSFL